MRKLLVIPAVAVTLALAPPAVAGQPNASCEAAGFATDGFATAEDHYAGSDGTPSAAHGNDHAVSQYDIACFGGPR